MAYAYPPVLVMISVTLPRHWGLEGRVGAASDTQSAPIFPSVVSRRGHGHHLSARLMGRTGTRRQPLFCIDQITVLLMP